MSNNDKIQYVKPKVQDLGAVAPVYGGTCPAGSLNAIGDCSSGGTADTGTCWGDGSSAAGGSCTAGLNVGGSTR
jgi:hypothetical protein